MVSTKEALSAVLKFNFGQGGGRQIQLHHKEQQNLYMGSRVDPSVTRQS
jgi:hypothetical protein